MNGRERELFVKVSLLKLGSTFASNIRRSNFLTQFYESVLPRARSERTGLLEGGVTSRGGGGGYFCVYLFMKKKKAKQFIGFV